MFRTDDNDIVNMGSDWRMPIQADMQEIIGNTTITLITLKILHLAVV